MIVDDVVGAQLPRRPDVVDTFDVAGMVLLYELPATVEHLIGDDVAVEPHHHDTVVEAEVALQRIGSRVDPQRRHFHPVHGRPFEDLGVVILVLEADLDVLVGEVGAHEIRATVRRRHALGLAQRRQIQPHEVVVAVIVDGQECGISNVRR